MTLVTAVTAVTTVTIVLLPIYSFWLSDSDTSVTIGTSSYSIKAFKSLFNTP